MEMKGEGGDIVIFAPYFTSFCPEGDMKPDNCLLMFFGRSTIIALVSRLRSPKWGRKLILCAVQVKALYSRTNRHLQTFIGERESGI